MDDYGRIERAMAYMVENAVSQPGLADVAGHVHLSAGHFQGLFTRYAGVSPKRFLQALTVARAKRLMASPQPLLDTALAVGLSGGSRLYDHFVQLDAMTPGEYRRRGADVMLYYAVHPTPLGKMLVVTTSRGICRMSFVEDASATALLPVLEREWPGAILHHAPDATRYAVDGLFHPPQAQVPELTLQVAGTNFQIAVWRALLTIPAGQLASYGQIAQALGRPGSSRAVGNAVGANPVALWIPCHRVIQQSGALGGYRWGTAKKQLVQAWEGGRDAARLTRPAGQPAL